MLTIVNFNLYLPHSITMEAALAWIDSTNTLTGEEVELLHELRGWLTGDQFIELVNEKKLEKNPHSLAMEAAMDWIESTNTLTGEEEELLRNLRGFLTHDQFIQVVNEIKMEKNLTDDQRQVWLQLKETHEERHIKEWLVLVAENQLSDVEMKVWIEERKIRKLGPAIEAIGIEDWMAQQFRRLADELQLKYKLSDMELEIWLEYPIRFTAEEMETWTMTKNHLSEDETILHLETRELKTRLEGHGLEEWVQIRQQKLNELLENESLDDEESDLDESKPTEFEIIEQKMNEWLDEKYRERRFYPLGDRSLYFNSYLW